MASGGQLSVAVRSNDETATAEIAVRDTGHGIPPETLRKIFDPYFTTKTADAQGQGGTGLGLALAREVIEAHHLFGLGFDRIDVVVHPQSVLHSVVEYVDGSWKGHLGRTDMRIPIQYALTAPGRAPSSIGAFELAGLDLTFEEPDRQAFPSLDMAFEAGRIGGSAPAVLNAADEVAVEAFLQHRLGFTGIFDVVAGALEQMPHSSPTTVDDVVEVDREARALAASLIAGAC